MEDKKENSGMGRRDVLKSLGLGAAASTLGILADPNEAVAQPKKSLYRLIISSVDFSVLAASLASN